MQELVIVGCGGFGREVAWLARSALPKGVRLCFAAESAHIAQYTIDDLPVLRLEELAPEEGRAAVVAIADCNARKRVAGLLEKVNVPAWTLVHPGVLRSERVRVGGGSIICAGSLLTTNIDIGRHVHVNLACTIGHDVVIGDHSTLAPGVRVSGNVHVGTGVYIGTGATIINGTAHKPLIIGDGAVIAASACVTDDVEPQSMVAGVPAVRKR
ncbi:NeuD/PglB/VioB family sugar acetyltransferase [Arenimonas fontis]|uniref:NeuD/PglB/VioB family sugar acetyltransferase n=1 Tax=Arenimonas fontis TaxID=2608255 RepID=UPI001661ADC2|nr:NeuD/PglB/VioB family sugar acetyltransferase [Arenimonas fontis]